MAIVKVDVITEVSLDVRLNKQEAGDLLFILKHGVTPPRVPSINPPTDIVRRLANALEDGLKQ